MIISFLFRTRLDQFKSERDQEICSLKEQSHRLQVQLNNGHSGFADFKEKKAKEVQDLKTKLEELSLMVILQVKIS